jgi:hypothetical protein
LSRASFPKDFPEGKGIQLKIGPWAGADRARYETLLAWDGVGWEEEGKKHQIYPCLMLEPKPKEGSSEDMLDHISSIYESMRGRNHHRVFHFVTSHLIRNPRPHIPNLPLHLPNTPVQLPGNYRLLVLTQ